VRAAIDKTLSNRTINLSNEQVTANSRYASGVIQYVIAFNIIRQAMLRLLQRRRGSE
jgi:hypothetical protein